MSSKSYEEAALYLGCTHYNIRMLVSKGRIRIDHREEVRPNVLKVFVSYEDLKAYKEENRVRHSKRYRLTTEEEEILDKALEEHHGTYR